MKFGRSLQQSIYEPWREQYINYKKLKALLREDDVVVGAKDSPWTDEDEQRFVDELVNVQLEKINAFQVDTYKTLKERTSQCEAKLEQYVAGKEATSDGGKERDEDEKIEFLNETSKELDSIREEVTRLEKFSRINFTGALKAAKKHDRRRGANYKVRPLLQVRLASLPFNAEDYSPLLYRLSAMYSFVRENLGEDFGKTTSNIEPPTKAGGYTSHKFFVHPENLLEVKTTILRHLPVLVYTPQSMKIAEGSQKDPTITSLYFDDSAFSLYSKKLEKESGVSSLRVRWYGLLKDQPDLVMDKKTLTEGADSREVRFSIKDKYVKSFIKGEYHMEKQILRMSERKGENSEEVKQLRKNVDDIQTFIRQSELEPILRANYTRTAFQIPGEDRVRISLDTNLAFIREDCLDSDRPCRDPEQWHRTDIDDSGEEYPFSRIRKGEVSRFPYALLEIKVREVAKRKHPEWVDDLMSSHLVREAPRFSKFVHGIASLFEDHINAFPFWMSLMETDIRRDPEEAFEEEQEKKAKQAEDEMAVGSFIGSKSRSPFIAAVGSPIKDSPAQKSIGTKSSGVLPGESRSMQALSNGQSDQPESHDSTTTPAPGSRLRSLFPAFSTSKYAQARRARIQQLPPGVTEPTYFLKDVGPVRVEPKVWLANQR
ncbi:Phosphate metabolism transcription protein [Thelotrema lepadinum]|nr:Phosphate metabolism transcription protein [Thelotrema lepadinum]